MLKIALDFDSTLFPTMEKVVDIYNVENCANINFQNITSYDLYDCFPHDVASELLKIFVDENVYIDIQPYNGSTKAVKTLVERGHEIYIATSSDIENVKWKEQLLQKYFPFIPKDNLIRIHNKSLLNVDVMIDDKLDNLKQTFADRICYDQLWNRSHNDDFVYGIYRVHHWGEVPNIINEIERKNKEWEK